MAKNKNHYFVMVCDEDGPKFVTGLGEHFTAYWNYNEPPMEFSKTMATEIVTGLSWSGCRAYLVQSTREDISHPYNYNKWCCQWIPRG